jgi:hypothetical protein
MDIPRDGREYAHWTITADVPDVAFQVQIDTTWYTLERVGTSNTYRLLIAGPDAPGSGAVVLTSGRHVCRAKFIDDPEIVVRSAGVIEIG